MQNSGVREEPVQQLAGDSGVAAAQNRRRLGGAAALVGCVCVEIESGAACPRMRSWSSS